MAWLSSEGFATVIDLRSPAGFGSWHYPGAMQLDYFEALKAYRSFEREKTYLFYCEVAIKSAHVAELMRAEGVEFISGVTVADGSNGSVNAAELLERADALLYESKRVGRDRITHDIGDGNALPALLAESLFLAHATEPVLGRLQQPRGLR